MKKIFMIAGLAVALLSCKKNDRSETLITVLQTADIHAYLNTHQELFVENDSIVFRKAGGLANIQTLAQQVRKENPEGTLLIDGGDLIQGSGESVLSEGSIFPPLIRAMQYDLLIPGNWEVVYGKKIMMETMKQYNTNVIVSNMYHEGDTASLFPPYWIVEKKGIKIGFIAYNDPEVPIRQNPMFSEGIIFTEVEKNLKALISQLKEKEKVDLLFLVAHIGISKQVLLANNPAVEGVDFILGNDTHERVRKPIEGKYTKVVEPGAFGSFVGRLDLKIKDKKIIDYTYELIEVNPEIYPADPTLQALVDSLTEPYQQSLQQVLGYTNTPLYRYLVVENPMDNFITDALRWKTNADFAVSNGFRFGVPILPDTTGKAAITKEDLWRMLPVDEHMKIGEVTGAQIKDWLEKEINNVFAKDPSKRFGGWLVRFSGMTLKFDSSKEMGERVQEVTIQGQPLNLQKTYRMASCNRTGEPLHVLCRMPNAQNVQILPYTLHEAVEAYLLQYGTIAPRIDGRAIASDLGETTFSQMPETGYRFR
jgi:sulfur-oxidizing protein SoxB